MIKKINKIWSVILVFGVLLSTYLANPNLLQSTKLNVFDSYQVFGVNYKSISLILLDIMSPYNYSFVYFHKLNVKRFATLTYRRLKFNQRNLHPTQNLISTATARSCFQLI